MTDTLAICAIVKNEARYIREWIEFHLLVGVDRFFIYDNDSDDETLDVLRPYYNADLVQIIRWPGAAAQLPAYQHALRAWGRSVKWMAFLDADEFLFTIDGQPIPRLLDTYRTVVAAVGVCWAVYGTGGVRHPCHLVAESYNYRTNDRALNCHVKSIVRTSLALDRRPADPHHFPVAGDSIDELGRPLQGPFAITPTHDLIRINHYISKSVAEARAKMERRRADNDELRTMDLLAESLNEVYDPAILPWARELRQGHHL
jgi:glycosyltransferase involved in cell wall biosynthesis